MKTKRLRCLAINSLYTVQMYNEYNKIPLEPLNSTRYTSGVCVFFVKSLLKPLLLEFNMRL